MLFNGKLSIKSIKVNKNTEAGYDRLEEVVPGEEYYHNEVGSRHIQN